MGFLKIELFEVIERAGDFTVATARAFLGVVEKDPLIFNLSLGFWQGFPLWVKYSFEVNINQV
jgi:hypothetical protein